MHKLALSHFITIAVVLVSASAAVADLTVKMTMISKTSIIPGVHISPSNRQMQKAFLAQENNFSVMTYISGNKTKAVLPSFVTITEKNSKQQTVLMPDHKSWYVEKAPFAPFSSVSKPENCVDMHKSKIVCGYKAELYKFTEDSAAAKVTGYVWSTQDLPKSLADAFNNSGGGAAAYGNFHGVPLDISVTAVMPQVGVKISSVCNFSDFSGATIPASVFDIPSDYKKTLSPDEEGKEMLAQARRDAAAQQKSENKAATPTGH